jgi:hypothetical protein
MKMEQVQIFWNDMNDSYTVTFKKTQGRNEFGECFPSLDSESLVMPAA